MGFILAGTYAPTGHITGRIYLSERNKASKGFIEKANDVGTAQNGAYIKPAKHGESQYGEKVESQRCEEISKQLSDEHHIMAVQSDKAVIDFFHEQIERIEKVVLKEVKLRYPYKELVTVPGIGEILGITIMLETGDINRFPTVSDYSSYGCGLCIM